MKQLEKYGFIDIPLFSAEDVAHTQGLGEKHCKMKLDRLLQLIQPWLQDIIESFQRGTAVVMSHVAMRFFWMIPECAQVLKEGVVSYTIHPCYWNHKIQLPNVYDSLCYALTAAGIEDTFIELDKFQELVKSACSISQSAARAAESEETKASRVEKLQALWDDDRREAFGGEVLNRYADEEYYDHSLDLCRSGSLGQSEEESNSFRPSQENTGIPHRRAEGIHCSTAGSSNAGALD